MRKSVAPFLFYLLPVLGLFSCAEEIQVELKNLPPTMVVEGFVQENGDAPFVKLHWSATYFDSAGLTPVTDAQVIVMREGEAPDVFSEVLPGLYRSNYLQALPGKFFLRIVKDGNAVEGEGILVSAPVIDSVTIQHQEVRGFIDAGEFVTLHFRERPGQGDFYRMRIFRNDSLYDDFRDIIILDDQVTESQYLAFEFPYPFESGDRVRAEILTLTETEARYYLALQNQLYLAGNPWGSPPGNLPQNLSGAAFGFFHVNGISSVEIIIP